jgi:cyanophycin synthetase
MRVRNIRSLDGPNIFTYSPVVLMELDLEDLAGVESHQLDGFVNRLLSMLPGLADHGCSHRRPGGFVERLHEGTYLGHVVEHVALELSEPAGIPVTYGKTVRAGANSHGVYHVAVESSCHPAMRHLLEVAVQLVQAAVSSQPFALDEPVRRARELVARSALGPSTAAIVDGAARRGIPVRRLDGDSLVQLGTGRHRRVLRAAMADTTSAVAVDVAADKQLTKDLLADAMLPVPRGRLVASAADTESAFEQLGGAVVVKPVDGQQGRGVTLGLRRVADVSRAYHVAAEVSRRVLVEEHIEGRDCRVLVVGGAVVAASHRRPPEVCGDGRQTVRELVDAANAHPDRGHAHEKYLTRIPLDDVTSDVLAEQGLSIESVPGPGATVLLRRTGNLSTGGTATDITDTLHPQIAAMCERAARVVGLDICGVDLVVDDHASPIAPGRGAIVELNASPGLRMHEHPSEGEARPAGSAIIDLLFPPGTASRVPIVSITGTNGKTTVTRMTGHVLDAWGWTVGMTTTDGISIGARQVAQGDLTGPQSARLVLADPAVDVAVLETARGGIARRGLGYDWSDVGVITNIQLDHIGQDGIETLDDLVHVKSLVAERVREFGRLVLNADDEVSARLMDHPRVARIDRQIALFSVHAHHVLISRHVAAGGTAYVVQGGWLTELTPGAGRRIMRTRSIPAAMGGAAACNVSNALAAVAAARGLGVPVEIIAAALSTFELQLHNPGRVNVFEVNGGHVLLDYAHNPAAIRAIGDLARGCGAREVDAVIGVPGDRADALIEECARAAADVFDRVIVREDRNLRGRGAGEVAGLLTAAFRRAAPGRECLAVLDSADAIRTAVGRLRPRELAVILFEQLDEARAVVQSMGAQPVASLPNDRRVARGRHRASRAAALSAEQAADASTAGGTRG